MKAANLNIGVNDPNIVQKKASDPSKSVYVSASAGTGKTKVLTDRFLRLLLAGFPATNIVCLTFTNSATVEMKRRIAAKLEEWSKMDYQTLKVEVDELNDNSEIFLSLRQIKALYNKFIKSSKDLNISTVHGFCQKILHKTNLSRYNKKIISSHERKELIKRVISNILDQDSEHNAKYLNFLYNHYEHGYIAEILKSIIDDKINFLHFYSKFTHENLNAFYNKAHEVNISTDLESGDANTANKFKEKIQGSYQTLQDVCCNSTQKTLLSFADFAFEHILSAITTKAGTPRKIFTSAERKKYPSDTEIILNAIDEFFLYLEERKKLISATINYSLANIAVQVLESYQKTLNDLKLTEFSDVIYLTNQFLQNSSEAHNTLYKLDYTIDHILVDEAQDLSADQWNIVKQISEEFFSGISARLVKRTVFIVGDFKQSICGFQGASPKIFLDMYKYFANKLSYIGEEFVKVDMQVSFRSTSPVINAVNKFFATHKVDEAQVEHISFKGGEGAVDCFELAEKIKMERKQGWQFPEIDTPITDERNICAKNIAAKIDTWLKSKRAIHGSKKAITPGDIMIVVKKREPMIRYLRYHLQSYGIPLANPDKVLFKNSLIINDLICLARFINYPYDDIALATILKSPIFALNDQDFHELCINDKDKKLYERINSPLVLEKLEKLQSLFSGSISNFYKLLETELDLANAYGTKYGEKYFSEISSFKGFVNELETTNPLLTLDDFIELAQDPELVIESFSSSIKNQVRIMTIHASKGLQAPVVIIADSTNTNSKNSHFLWYDNVPFFNISDTVADSLTHSIKKHTKNEEQEEDLRLLYVAMTRAENELYFSGSESKGFEKSWYTNFKNHGIISTLPETLGHANNDISQEHIKINKTSKNLVPNEITDQASSKFNTYEEGAKFGNLLHDYLEIINNHPTFSKDSFNDKVDEQAYQKALKVKDYFPELFGKNALAEVPLTGNNNGKIYKFKIDKLIISPDKITIIDYKTDSDIPKTSDQIKQVYVNQLKHYAKVLQSYYPNQKVDAKILWVNKLKLMEVKI